jgi:hypothetical protein
MNDRWSWRETLSWRVGLRRAKAGRPYACPWWADEHSYGIAYLQGLVKLRAAEARRVLTPRREMGATDEDDCGLLAASARFGVVGTVPPRRRYARRALLCGATFFPFCGPTRRIIPTAGELFLVGKRRQPGAGRKAGPLFWPPQGAAAPWMRPATEASQRPRLKITHGRTGRVLQRCPAGCRTMLPIWLV